MQVCCKSAGRRAKVAYTYHSCTTSESTAVFALPQQRNGQVPAGCGGRHVNNMQACLVVLYWYKQDKVQVQTAIGPGSW